MLDWNPARAFYEHLGATPSAAGYLKSGMDAAALQRLLERTGS